MSDEMKAPATNIAWQAADTRGPDRAKWPGRQFVFLEGECWHSGIAWGRQGWGVLNVSGITKTGYNTKQWRDLCQILDMEEQTAQVTHWAPAAVNWPDND